MKENCGRTYMRICAKLCGFSPSSPMNDYMQIDENLSLFRPVWNTNMSQSTDRSSSKLLTSCKERQKKNELNLLIRIY